MDITSLFKACVKTVRATNKNLGIKDQNSNILKAKHPKDPNLEHGKEILRQITKLHQVLLDNKAAYLKVLDYTSTNKTMTEFDRQQIDTMAENIINKCSILISEYKSEIKHVLKSKQKEDHYKFVIESIENYLKNVSKVYTGAKAVRVKRVVENHKLSKLELTPNIITSDKSTLELPKDLSPSKQEKERKSTPITPPTPPGIVEEELSAEEMQMFEQENELLYNELNSISDEVKQMESKVVHIAELQEMFTEKVLQQEQDIERISTTVVNATENVRGANEQIRQAIQRNAGLRVWVLFFLLVMSFSLLFLDWYND